MKKIINGKKYDTETAKRLATYDNIGKGNIASYTDFNYWCTSLYRKRTGEYFIYKQDKAWNDREEPITPATEEEAKTWSENYLDGDEYEAIWGEVEE